MSEMARFRSLSEENIAQLLNDKDSENTKKSTKQHRLIFESYLKEKNIRNPTTAVELAAVLRKFYAEARKKDGQMCIIHLGIRPRWITPSSTCIIFHILFSLIQ